jgi:hypothetical protein
MTRRKPAGWPKLMVSKRLKTGATAYYWDVPTWAKKKGCTLGSEALGGDYPVAKQRCDEVLNPQFDSWRVGGSASVVMSNRPAAGTFDWMVSIYKSLPSLGTRADLKGPASHMTAHYGLYRSTS